jgi:hypothetical protein
MSAARWLVSPSAGFQKAEGDDVTVALTAMQVPEPVPPKPVPFPPPMPKPPDPYPSSGSITSMLFTEVWPIILRFSRARFS